VWVALRIDCSGRGQQPGSSGGHRWCCAGSAPNTRVWHLGDAFRHVLCICLSCTSSARSSSLLPPSSADTEKWLRSCPVSLITQASKSRAESCLDVAWILIRAISALRTSAGRQWGDLTWLHVYGLLVYLLVATFFFQVRFSDRAQLNNCNAMLIYLIWPLEFLVLYCIRLEHDLS